MSTDPYAEFAAAAQQLLRVPSDPPVPAAPEPSPAAPATLVMGGYGESTLEFGATESGCLWIRFNERRERMLLSPSDAAELLEALERCREATLFEGRAWQLDLAFDWHPGLPNDNWCLALRRRGRRRAYRRFPFGFWDAGNPQHPRQLAVALRALLGDAG